MIEDNTLDRERILVSISTITFNHASNIRQCLDGFLMQKTNFAFEVLIHDDASTDGTIDIIREYEAKYPDIIKPLYEVENQWVKGRRGSAIFNFPRAKGKYIAMCEGDDYWTDPLKLQKQVDFLEEHENYILTTGGYQEKFKGEIEDKIKSGHPTFIEETDKGFTYNLNTRGGWKTKTLTALFRNKKNILDKTQKYKYSNDNHLFYHLLKEGKGYYFKDIFGVYNIHSGGIFSTKSKNQKLQTRFLIYKELYAINKDDFTRRKYFNTSLKYLHKSIYRKVDKKEISILGLCRETWKIQNSFKDKKKIILALFPRRVGTVYAQMTRGLNKNRKTK